MSYLVSLAIEQGLTQVTKFNVPGQSKNLFLVVVVDKGLDCLDR